PPSPLPAPRPTPLPYTTLFRSAARLQQAAEPGSVLVGERTRAATRRSISYADMPAIVAKGKSEPLAAWIALGAVEEPGVRVAGRSEEHTSELQSRGHLVCRLLL